MQILPGGLRYPSTELLAFRARKLAGDCPTGRLIDCPGVVEGLYNYAVAGSEVFLVLADAVFEFPYTLARQEQRLITSCQYGHHGGDSTVDFVGKIRKLAGEEAERARRLLLDVHSSGANEAGCSMVSLEVERVFYSGLFPEAGEFGPEFLRDGRLGDNRKQYPEVCLALNESFTAALLRAARHYLQGQPPIRDAVATRVDSSGLTIRARNGHETRFLRMDFAKRIDSASDAEAQVREVTAPGYDKRRLAELLHREADSREESIPPTESV